MGFLLARPLVQPPLAQLSLPLLALGAVPVELVSMPQQPEAVALHDVLLRLLDHGALELDDPPAARAHQMVVVLLLDLEAGEAVVEVTLARETGLAQQLHGAIDGRVADLRMTLAHPLVQLLARDVALHAEEHLEDRLTLSRVLEVVALEIFGESLVLEVVRHVGDRTRWIRSDQLRGAQCASADACAAWRFSAAARLSQSSETARSKARSASVRR